MPHGLVSSLLQDAVDVVQGGAVLATRKFVLGSLLWAVVGGKCSLEVVGFQCRGVSGLYLLCQADHVEFTPVEVLMDEAVFCIIGMRALAKQPAFCQRCCPLTPYTHWQHIASLCSFTRERALSRTWLEARLLYFHAFSCGDWSPHMGMWRCLHGTR